jgi:hypothetical protein
MERKITVNGEVCFIKINSMAIPSSVGFQMLEGLQTGQNLTWRLLQKNITQFMDINLNYQAEKVNFQKLFILETSN